MNEKSNSKNNNVFMSKTQENGQLSDKGLFINDDDQDWGSAGMNDIQSNSE